MTAAECMGHINEVQVLATAVIVILMMVAVACMLDIARHRK